MGKEIYTERFIIGISVIIIAAIIVLKDVCSKERKRKRLVKALVEYEQQKKYVSAICDMEIRHFDNSIGGGE